MEKISEHITLAEWTYSETAQRMKISNDPTPAQIANGKITAEKVFEPLRKHFGVPIKINSGFRIQNLNVAIGGSSTSQHCGGQALDLSIQHEKLTNADLFNWLKNNVEYDQLIWELGSSKNPQWVHVSYAKTGNRKQTLVCKISKETRKKIYENFK
jgi:hypothetical protein